MCKDSNMGRRFVYFSVLFCIFVMNVGTKLGLCWDYVGTDNTQFCHMFG